MFRTSLVFICVALAVLCSIGISCKKDNPVQPTPPGHTAISFQATFTSIRWCRLQWTNDSSAPSYRYVLIRDNRDTVYADTSRDSIIAVHDSLLAPGTTYVYWLYRVVNSQHWDSASVTVHTLDTTDDNLTWTVTRWGENGGNSVLRGIWAASAASVWLSGVIDSSSVGKGYNLVHVRPDTTEFYTLLGADGLIGSCYGRSDSDLWICGNGTIWHWTGDSAITYGTWNGGLPNKLQTAYLDIWETPSGAEVWAVGNGGKIAHRMTDGTWELQKSGTTLALTSIRGFANHDIYVSSVKANCNGCEGVILHYDGNAWTEIAHGYLPPPTDTNLLVGDFSSISGESHDSIFAVGERIYKATPPGWRLADAPCNERLKPSCGAYAESVSALVWNDVWVVGDFGWMMHFDGERWKTNFPFFNSSVVSALDKIVTVSGEVFAVGQDHTSAYLIHGK
jgi:hypothetical protein